LLLVVADLLVTVVQVVVALVVFLLTDIFH
jgi:hypothetical protein